MVKLIQQMIKFGFVGVLCFFIDYGIMVFLTEVFGINYMVSSTVSFSVSVTVNYILSVAFVFETDKDKNKIKHYILLQELQSFINMSLYSFFTDIQANRYFLIS